MRPGSPFLPKALCIWFCVLLGVVPAGAAEPPDQLGTVWVQVSGNNQRVQPGATFFLQVRLGEPAQGVHIGVGNIETSGPTISCDNDLTDGAGFAQIDCIAGAWPIETTVRITLIDIFGRTAPTFNITVAPFTLLEGLTQPAGPRATVARGMDFELGVQAVRNGAPQLDLELIVERMPIAAPVSCPAGSSPRQRAEFRRQLPEFASVMGWIGRSASVYRLLVRQRNPQRIEDFCLAGVGNRQPCDAGLLIHSIFQ